MSRATEGERFAAFEAEGWEGAATPYERFFGPITDRLIDPVLDATGVGPRTRLLDVACGPGNLSGRAATRGARPIGVDMADAMLANARRAHPGIEFRRGDAHSLPFAAGMFDVAVANFAILHLSEPERGVAELARVLVPGGKVALTVWDVPERARLFGWVTEAMAQAGAGPPGDIPAGPPFFRFADDDEMRGLLDGNGFEAAAVRTITFAHAVASVDLVWTGIVGGTVRTAALVRKQPPAAQHAIRAAFEDVVARESPGGRIAIPFSVKLATASKPDERADGRAGCRGGRGRTAVPGGAEERMEVVHRPRATTWGMKVGGGPPPGSQAPERSLGTGALPVDSGATGLAYFLRV